MSWISVGATAATGIYSMVKGAGQKRRAKQMEGENIRPTYQIPEEILRNQKMAEQLSTTGIQGGEYQRATQNINRASQSALDKATDRRGGLATIGAIEQQKQDAFGNLTIQDTQQRMANIRNLMQQNQTLAGYRDKAFGYNQEQKYQENAAAIRALYGAGEANQNTALNSLFSAGVMAAGTALPKKQDVSTGSLTGKTESFIQSRPMVNQSLIPQQTTPSYQQQVVDATPKDPTVMPDFYGEGENSLGWLKNFNRK